MPGIYGPPPPPKPTAPPARPESTAIKVLRWTGTIAIFIAAMYLWYLAELGKGPSEQEQRLIEMQRSIERINLQPLPRLDITPVPFEPLQTADIIPSSAFIKPTAPAEAQPALETATIIPPR